MSCGILGLYDLWNSLDIAQAFIVEVPLVTFLFKVTVFFHPRIALCKLIQPDFGVLTDIELLDRLLPCAVTWSVFTASLSSTALPGRFPKQ